MEAKCEERKFEMWREEERQAEEGDKAERLRDRKRRKHGGWESGAGMLNQRGGRCCDKWRSEEVGLSR